MTISTDKNGICVELHGREQFWSLRAKVTIPTNTITDVRFEPKFQDWRKWQVRMPGTHAPKLLLAGSYWTEEGWDFLYVKRPIGFMHPRVEDVLVVETDQNRYKRIVVSLDEAESTGIIKWWNQNKLPVSKSKKTTAKKSSTTSRKPTKHK
ncbi:MAG: hypothetical protein M3Q14_03600 [bacterium]|nr:hypothetical protein [bacterium]